MGMEYLYICTITCLIDQGYEMKHWSIKGTKRTLDHHKKYKKSKLGDKNIPKKLIRISLSLPVFLHIHEIYIARLQLKHVICSVGGRF